MEHPLYPGQTAPHSPRVDDLRKADYYGHVGMSAPSRSGTTHLAVETILQGEGWQLMTEIGGNFKTVAERSFGVPDGGNSGNFGIGIVKNAPNAAAAGEFIDFLLSPEGQELLLDPKIRRLPVNPQTYAKRLRVSPTPSRIRLLAQRSILVVS